MTSPSPLSETPDPARSDLLIVFGGSCLLIAYLTFCLLLPEPTHAEEKRPAPPPLTAPTGDDVVTVPLVDGEPPWVRDHKPVPSWSLYPYTEAQEHMAPIPPTVEKEESWWHKLLFPTVHCPYCGRRVPSKKGSYLFLIIGLVGQIAFSGRFLVQWIASEKAKDSVIPEAFWWLSIFGSLLLLTYAISVWALPIILGQAPNVAIYGRNLYFVKRRKQALAVAEESS